MKPGKGSRHLVFLTLVVGHQSFGNCKLSPPFALINPWVNNIVHMEGSLIRFVMVIFYSHTKRNIIISSLQVKLKLKTTRSPNTGSTEDLMTSCFLVAGPGFGVVFRGGHFFIFHFYDVIIFPFLGGSTTSYYYLPLSIPYYTTTSFALPFHPLFSPSPSSSSSSPPSSPSVLSWFSFFNTFSSHPETPINNNPAKYYTYPPKKKSVSPHLSITVCLSLFSSSKIFSRA